MPNSTIQLLDSYKRKLLKAFIHLEYSFEKIKKISDNPSNLNEEEMEIWEGFAARFSRVVDIFLSKYLRAYNLVQDQGFRGSMRDNIDFGEKNGLIDDADAWMHIRGLRNITALDYTEEQLQQYFLELKQVMPRLLKIKSKL